MKHLENHSFITSAAAAASAAASAVVAAAITLEPCFSLLRENVCVLQGGCSLRVGKASHGTVTRGRLRTPRHDHNENKQQRVCVCVGGGGGGGGAPGNWFFFANNLKLSKFASKRVGITFLKFLETNSPELQEMQKHAKHAERSSSEFHARLPCMEFRILLRLAC
jgi:hypothetical protein